MATLDELASAVAALCASWSATAIFGLISALAHVLLGQVKTCSVLLVGGVVMCFVTSWRLSMLAFSTMLHLWSLKEHKTYDRPWLEAECKILELEVQSQLEEEIAACGSGQIARSLLLDPAANNLPRSTTQSRLNQMKREINMPHMSYDIDGDITFKPAGVAATVAGRLSEDNTIPPAAIPGLAMQAAGELSGQYSGKTSLDLPAVLQLSYAGELTDRTQLLLGIEHTDWSSLDRLVIEHGGTKSALGGQASLPNPAIEEFNWEDTTRYSAGVRHTLQNDTVLRFGLAKEESTQSSDNRSAISPDSDRIWATIGAGFKPAENLSIDVAYAHIFVDDADIYKDSRGAVLDGTYELDANVIGAQLNYQF